MNQTNFRTIAVVGLGYVGLPLAVAFGKSGLKVIGFDINEERIKQLVSGNDVTKEITKDGIKKAKIIFTIDANLLLQANLIIIAVPTPITKSKKPDLNAIISASKIVARHIKKGAYIVYESTVYPGLTEELSIPLLENYSHKKEGKDFFVGYSPERINPGDKLHTIDKVIKVVSGTSPQVAIQISKIYKVICLAGVYIAPSIKVAEAAKVIENIQRDVNIALVNELSQIFYKLKINTYDVLAAAQTKWNFTIFYPGLVGGHCVGIDPYYLIEKAQTAGYNPQLISHARSINDEMVNHIILLLIDNLKTINLKINQANIGILGLTFKENVLDDRNSKIYDLIKKLSLQGAKVICFDPNIQNKNLNFNKVTDIDKFPQLNVLIIAVKHRNFDKIFFSKIKLKLNKNCLILDLTGTFEYYDFTKNTYRLIKL